MAEMYPSHRPGEYIVFVSQAMYDDLVKAGRERGYAPTQRLPSQSFAEYVKRHPRPEGER